MSQLLIDLANATTITQILSQGNANGNGAVLDLQLYKGPITFILGVGQTTTVGSSGNLPVAVIQQSSDASTYTNVGGGAFTAVVNTANASNIGAQVKTFDSRALSRYVKLTIEVSGTNANVPVSGIVIGQKERGT